MNDTPSLGRFVSLLDGRERLVAIIDSLTLGDTPRGLVLAEGLLADWDHEAGSW